MSRIQYSAFFSRYTSRGLKPNFSFSPIYLRSFSSLCKTKNFSTIKMQRTPSILKASAINLAHPSKKGKSEDSYLMSSCGRVIGVADGVGGWGEYGVDSGAYSRELLDHAKSFAMSETLFSPNQILSKAAKKVQAKGSSTACILTYKTLDAVVLGDSGFMVLRRGYIDGSKKLKKKHVFMDFVRDCMTRKNSSEEKDYKEDTYQSKPWGIVMKSCESNQLKGFNFPNQLGTGSSDTVEDADSYKLLVKPGDLILAATDGLFDNVWNNEITSLLDDVTSVGGSCGIPVNKSEKETIKNGLIHGLLIDKLAEIIAKLALVNAKSTSKPSPFSRNARQCGYEFEGGKMDDITVVTAVVT